MRSEWNTPTRKISSWGNAALTLIAQGRSDVSGQRKFDQVVLVLSLCFAAALFEGADAVSLGLGGLLPTLIAIASEVSGNSRKAGRVGKMFCGVPLGASLLGFLTAGVGLGWRAIFAVCGVGPLLLALVLAALLPETAPSAALADPGVERAPAGFFSVLFAERRAARTLLLWTAAYFTSAAIWILVGWFPSLMVARGFSPF